MLKERCCRGWGGGLGPGGVLLPSPNLPNPRCWDCTRTLGLAELATLGTTGDRGDCARGDGETEHLSTAVLSCWGAG